MSTEANKSTAESSAVAAALGGVLAVVIVTAAVIVVALVIVILILLRKLHKAEEGIYYNDKKTIYCLSRLEKYKGARAI